MAQIKDKQIVQAKELAEQDAAKSSGRDTKTTESVAEQADELLDEIDALLEETSIMTSYRQRGGQ